MSETRVRRPNRRPIPGLADLVNGGLCRSSGKVRYLDERTARIARDQVAAHDPNPDEVGVYRHEACGDWHVGHQPGRTAAP